MRKRNIFLACLGLVVVLAGIFYWFTVPHYKDLILVGTVDASQVIVSSKITGRIEKLMVDEGQTVRAGDLIATIDSEQYQAQRKAAEAQLSSLRSQVASNDAIAASTSGDTANQVALAQANLRSAQAALREDEANLQLQKVSAERTATLEQLGYTKIYAPASAKVNLRVAREGEVVNPGSPIVVLVDLTQTWVYVPLPETYADRIQLGEQLTVRMPSGTEAHMGVYNIAEEDGTVSSAKARSNLGWSADFRMAK